MAQVGDYRLRVPNEPEVTTNAVVHIEVFVERCTDATQGAEVWVLVDGGHFTERIDAALFLQAQNGGEVLDYIVNKVKTRGIVESDRAKQHILSLVGGSWAQGGYTKTFTV